MRSGLVKLAVLSALFWVHDTSVAQQPSSNGHWLAWSAPPECPGIEHIESQLERWLGEDCRASAEDVRARASVSWQEDQWTVVVRLHRHGDESTRQVVVQSCTEAADFVDQ